MKPRSKTMKIGFNTTTKPEKEILNSFLANYCDTLHLCVDIAPGGMLLRDGFKSLFPH